MSEEANYSWVEQAVLLASFSAQSAVELGPSQHGPSPLASLLFSRPPGMRQGQP